jgi:hypothetical protein
LLHFLLTNFSDDTSLIICFGSSLLALVAATHFVSASKSCRSEYGHRNGPGGSNHPLDVPDIQFNFFQDGADTDLQAIFEAITFGRDSFARQLIPYDEQQPGENLET